MGQRGRSLVLFAGLLAGCATPSQTPAVADETKTNSIVRNGRLVCDDRAIEPERNREVYRFIADYVTQGGWVAPELRLLSWKSSDMVMSIIPGFPPSHAEIPATFVLVLGQCGQAMLREMPIFEVVEIPLGSGRWETDGGYPLHVYTMKVD
ncbi:MAG: hypothetical protein R3C46_05530 [Hyphomonadaceae bacterium]